MRARGRSRVAMMVLAAAAGLLSASEARAQQAPAPGAFQLIPAEPLQSVRYHASFMLSGGFDLDVFGNVLEGALGARDRAQLAVRQSVPWPDVYVAVPKRAELTVGFGVFRKDEVVLRLSHTTYTSEPLQDAGNYVEPGAAGDLTVGVSRYRERSWEIGWRHYLVLTRRVKQYANMIYGIRTVDPISADFLVSEPVGRIGTFRLYDRSEVPTISLELGLTFEAAHVGVFAQVGGRWQGKLRRNDDELAAWSLQGVNNTGPRLYIPLQFGVLFRL